MAYVLFSPIRRVFKIIKFSNKSPKHTHQTTTNTQKQHVHTQKKKKKMGENRYTFVAVQHIVE